MEQKKESHKGSVTSNTFYYHMTATKARRVFVLLSKLELLLSSDRLWKGVQDERFVLKNDMLDGQDQGIEGGKVDFRATEKRPRIHINTGKDRGLVLYGVHAVDEYIFETYDEKTRFWRGEDRAGRAKVRSFIHYVDDTLEHEVVAPILKERLNVGWSLIEKRHIPSSENLVQARQNLQRQLEYLEYTLGKQPYVAGHQHTYADIALASSLTLLDFLGEIGWSRLSLQQLKRWYQEHKRHCRFLLDEQMPSIEPPENYNRLHV